MPPLALNEKRAAGTNGDARIFSDDFGNNEPGWSGPTWRKYKAFLDRAQLGSSHDGDADARDPSQAA